MVSTSHGRVRVLVVDEYVIIREGLGRLLAQDNGSVVEFGSAIGVAELEETFASASFECVLIGDSHSAHGGLDVIARVLSFRRDVPILVLSAVTSAHYAYRALRAGAAGFLTPKSPVEDLISAIQRIAAGGRFLSSELAEELAGALGRPDADRPLHASLSDREFEVFCRLAKGQTVTEIADALILSVKTISTNRTRVLRKMLLNNNSELMRYALEQRLVN